MRHIILAAAILAGGGVGTAQAQANLCNGRVSVDAVYPAGVGNARYEYFVQVRNTTDGRLVVDVEFSGFPPAVTLFSRSLPNIPLGPWASSGGIRFGNGTDGMISTPRVQVVYDRAPGPGPTVRVTNCRSG